MRLRLLELRVRTRRTLEAVTFSPTVTFLHGPVGTGKSTVARLIDYCLGGDLERTPALQQEFLSAELAIDIGCFRAQFERGATDAQAVRVTWTDGEALSGSVNAPFVADSIPLVGETVYTFSDLVFWLAGVEPIKVRRSKSDPDSPLVRLSIRDLLAYCYLEQDHLDSSFFRMEDPFRKLKSRDAMRFVTGLYSERMNILEGELARAVDDQRSKREAVEQVRRFMTRFQMDSETDLSAQMRRVGDELAVASTRRDELERTRHAQTHNVEPLRARLRALSDQIDDLGRTASDLDRVIGENEALRAEFISAKIKAGRAEQAGQVLPGASFERCPQCGADLSSRVIASAHCFLCGSGQAGDASSSTEMEALRRDLNDRIDEVGDALARRRRERTRLNRSLDAALDSKRRLDDELARELAAYDSSFVASIRAADRDVARLQERLLGLERLQEMPAAISDLERAAGELQGAIDVLRSSLAEERTRLTEGDLRVHEIAERFLAVMRSVGFPGVYDGDTVELDPRYWQPQVRHGDVLWTFHDAGSGGKKTLFNVCYALAVHAVAAEHDLPLPPVLIIDSPTKNISEDEDPLLVRSLYRAIYELATREGRSLQFLLIDSDLVLPESEIPTFQSRRMAGEPDAPALISYYEGP